MVWDDVRDGVRQLRWPGAPVQVIGRYVVHPRYGPQVNLRALRPAEPGSFDARRAPRRPGARASSRWRATCAQLIATIQRPPLRTLLERMIGRAPERWPAYRDAPAAKFYHQAYRHGLLEHSLSVGQAVSAISATFPGIDRDVAVTGALLHDIGKLDAYTRDEPGDRPHRRRPPAGRDRARLLPRAPRDRVDRRLPARAREGARCTSSSPTTAPSSTAARCVPATREATLVHMVDNLGGRLGSFDRLEKELRDGERWSGFDRALGGGAFFAAPRGAERAAQLDAA